MSQSQDILTSRLSLILDSDLQVPVSASHLGSFVLLRLHAGALCITSVLQYKPVCLSP